MILFIFGSILTAVMFCEIFEKNKEQKEKIKNLEEQLWCYKAIHDIDEMRLSKFKKAKEESK